MKFEKGDILQYCGENAYKLLVLEAGGGVYTMLIISSIYNSNPKGRTFITDYAMEFMVDQHYIKIGIRDTDTARILYGN